MKNVGALVGALIGTLIGTLIGFLIIVIGGIILIASIIALEEGDLGIVGFVGINIMPLLFLISSSVIKRVSQADKDAIDAVIGVLALLWVAVLFLVFDVIMGVIDVVDTIGFIVDSNLIFWVVPMLIAAVVAHLAKMRVPQASENMIFYGTMLSLYGVIALMVSFFLTQTMRGFMFFIPQLSEYAMFGMVGGAILLFLGILLLYFGVKHKPNEKNETQVDIKDLEEEMRLYEEMICKYCSGKRSDDTGECSTCGKGNSYLCHKCSGTFSETTGECKNKNCSNSYYDCMYCEAKGMLEGVCEYSGICKSCGRPFKY